MEPAAACSKPCLSTAGGRSAHHDRVFVWAHCDRCNCSFSVHLHVLEQSHSWKADSSSSNQDILPRFGNRHFVTVTSTVHPLSSCHFSTPYMPGFPNVTFLNRSPPKVFALQTRTCQLHGPYHSAWFGDPNKNHAACLYGIASIFLSFLFLMPHICFRV